MKAIVCSSPFRLDLIDIEPPTLVPGHAIVKILRIGVCGTDLHAYEGTQPFFNYPRVLGHELAGEIVDIEESSEFRRGDVVTFMPYLNCGICSMCKQGRTNCCMNLKVFGVHADGGMKEYVVVPSAILLKAPGLDADVLALIEPLSVAAHGIRRSGLNQRDRVIVAGAGPIGFGLIALAMRKGIDVIVIDVNDERLSFCKRQLQVRHTINPLKEDALAMLTEITNGEMGSVVFDATGNLNALKAGFKYMGHGARYVLVGLQSGEISFGHPEFHKKEGTLMSSRNATREDFMEVISAIASRQVDPLQMVTHRVKFEQVPNEFGGWLSNTQNVLKVLVEVG
jgi:2-desacetyl-2-hydroxyethyl bacteriochlorophyllide A dehydrogenase